MKTCRGDTTVTLEVGVRRRMCVSTGPDVPVSLGLILPPDVDRGVPGVIWMNRFPSALGVGGLGTDAEALPRGFLVGTHFA